MKNLNPIFWLIPIAVVGLGIAGISFFATATSSTIPEAARTPALVAGPAEERGFKQREELIDSAPGGSFWKSLPSLFRIPAGPVFRTS